MSAEGYEFATAYLRSCESGARRSRGRWRCCTTRGRPRHGTGRRIPLDFHWDAILDNSEACGITLDALGAVAHRCHAVLKLAHSAVAAPEQHLRESVNVRAAHLPQISHHRRASGCEECANVPLALVLPLRVGSGAIAPHHQRRRARGQARDRVAIAKLLSRVMAAEYEEAVAFR